MASGVNATQSTGGPCVTCALRPGISQQRVAQEADCSLSMVRLLEAGWEPKGRSRVLDRIKAVLSNDEDPAADRAFAKEADRDRRGSG